jgi:hypothetical protein
VIDAIDEVNRGGVNELASLVRDAWANTPDWLRLVVTSLPEPELVSALAAFEPLHLDVEAGENRSDLEQFVRAELEHLAVRADTETVERLIERTGGVFLYAVLVLEDVAAGRTSLREMDRLPVGLGGYYRAAFERRFPDVNAYRARTRPILDCVSAARVPLPLALLAEALGETPAPAGRARISALDREPTSGRTRGRVGLSVPSFTAGMAHRRG